MLNKLFSHALLYGLAPQVSSVAGIIALPIITKDLTAVDYGIWGVLLAYMGALQALFFLGMGVVLSNSFFRMPEQHTWLWRQIYGFLLLWSIPFTVLVGLLLWYVMPTEALLNRWTIILLLLIPQFIFGPTIVIANFYYQLRQKPIPVAIRATIFGLCTVVLNVFLISYLKLGYMGWIWTVFIVTLLTNISYLSTIINNKLLPIFNFKWRTIRNSFQVALPTIPHQYSSYLLENSDRVVMDQLQVGTGNLGGYNLASSFGSYFNSIAIACNTAITPIMIKEYKKKNDLLPRNLIFALQVFMLSITFLFAIWSREIFGILIQNSFLAGFYPLAIIVIMAYNYRPMYIGAMNKLFFVEKTKLLWRVSFIAGVSNIIMNLIFIPIFGFEAAAYTTFISLMYMGFAGFFIKKIRTIHDVNYYPLIWLSIIIVLTLLATWSVELDAIYKVLLTFSVILSVAAVYMKNRGMFSLI